VATETPRDIENLAEQAARELLQAMPTLETAEPIEREFEIFRALHRKQGSARTLKEVFSNDSSFGDLRDGWIQQGGGLETEVERWMVPRLLINAVIEGHSAKSLVEEARAFAISRTSTTEWYGALSEAPVSEEVNLGDNIDLVPWSDVPDGNQKRLFSRDPPRRVELRAGLSPSDFRHMPAASADSAVRIRSPQCQVLFSSYEDAEAAFEGSISPYVDRVVGDVARCVTALSVRPAAMLGLWAQFDTKIANDLVAGNTPLGYSSALFDRKGRAGPSKPMILDAQAIARLVRLFEDFKPSEKHVVRIAIDRLHQVLRKRSNVDRAIDLGIALEVMLLHNIGRNDLGELKFRLSIRGATFLGGEKPERLKTLKLLKDAYDLRSRAVHSGLLEEEKKNMLDDVALTCARIARKLIERGSFPDWDTEYVIGG